MILMTVAMIGLLCHLLLCFSYNLFFLVALFIGSASEQFTLLEGRGLGMFQNLDSAEYHNLNIRTCVLCSLFSCLYRVFFIIDSADCHLIYVKRAKDFKRD